MGWYFCDQNHAGLLCNICKKPVKEKEPVYFQEKGSRKDEKTGYYKQFGVAHTSCELKDK